MLLSIEGVVNYLDKNRKVVDELQKAFTNAGKNVLVLSEYVNKPSSFPCAMIRNISNSSYRLTMDNSLKAHHSMMTFQIDYFSNKTLGGKFETKELAQIGDEAMTSMKFFLDSFVTITNEDRTISRTTARYNAIVEEAKTIDGNTVHQIYR